MEIRFLSVGCGDGIHIRFEGDDCKVHHIFIDGGVETGNIYSITLRVEIEEIIKKGQIIDLWIITHLDDDHIGGILRFVRDERLLSRLDLSKTQFWFNYVSADYDMGSKEDNLKSVKQGLRLRDWLTSRVKLQEAVTDEWPPFKLFGVQMTILSPNRGNLDKLVRKWQKAEASIIKKEISTMKVASRNDYETKLEDFELGNLVEDSSEENGSSIAMLLEYKKYKILLSADSHPSVVSTSLRRLGYSPEDGKRLDLVFMQIAHHGSKFNTSDELLELVNCQDFVISGDGMNKHNLPNKETIARILKNVLDRPVSLYLTHKNPQTSTIFRVDGDLPGIELRFPESGKHFLTFQI